MAFIFLAYLRAYDFPSVHRAEQKYFEHFLLGLISKVDPHWQRLWRAVPWLQSRRQPITSDVGKTSLKKWYCYSTTLTKDILLLVTIWTKIWTSLIISIGSIDISNNLTCCLSSRQQRPELDSGCLRGTKTPTIYGWIVRDILHWMGVPEGISSCFV